MILLCILVFMCPAGDDYNGMVRTRTNQDITLHIMIFIRIIDYYIGIIITVL